MKLTLIEISAIYRCTPRTFARRVRSQHIPHEKCGRFMLFNLAQVENFLANQEVKTTRTFRKGVSGIKSTSSKFAEALGL